MTGKPHLDRLKTLRSLSALVALSAALGACTVYGGEVVTATVPPTDYRQRHPIAVQEANRSIVVFVGTGRGGLSPPQRDDVRGLGAHLGQRRHRRHHRRRAGQHAECARRGIGLARNPLAARGGRRALERHPPSPLYA